MASQREYPPQAGKRVVDVRSPARMASKVEADETPSRRSRPYEKYMLALTAGSSDFSARADACPAAEATRRTEEQTSELQSLMRISDAVFCLHTKNSIRRIHT